MFPSEHTLEITIEAAAALLQNSGEPVLRLIDCREDDEFAHCRIEGAELVPISRFGQESAARFPHPGDEEEVIPIIIYCHHGMRSLSATQFLREKGHRQVWSLQGGIDAWSRQIDPEIPRY